jgi:polysaccharide biosynthesis protein PslG
VVATNATTSVQKLPTYFHSLGRRLAKCLSLLAVLTVAALAVPAFAQAVEPGTSPDLTWGTSNADQDRTAAALQDVGSRWVRLNVEWGSTETSNNSYDSWMLSHYDRAVNVARAAGQKVLMLVSQSPSWASGSSDKQAPPQNAADYADFVRFLAARWAGKVEAWEVWNEPNIDRFWPTGPSAAKYTELLKAAYPAIKSGDPNAKVVFAGPSTNDYGFIEGAYNAGAKGYFDVMATHPYSCKSPEAVWQSNGRVSQFAYLGYREIRKSMLARGDDKPIWFTEMGWSTSTQECGVSEATQADYLKKAFALAAQDSYVQVAFWYNFRNNYWMHDADDIESRYGLLRSDFSHKPAYDAFKACASGGCGSAASGTAPTGSTSPGGAALKISLKVKRAHAKSAARSSRASASKRGASRLVLGHVSGANSGRVTVTLQRLVKGHWAKAKTMRTTVKASGAFTKSIKVKRGKWRVRASHDGSGSRSGFVNFKL